MPSGGSDELRHNNRVPNLRCKTVTTESTGRFDCSKKVGIVFEVLGRGLRLMLLGRKRGEFCHVDISSGKQGFQLELAAAGKEL